jgi:hypothetical protein
MSIDRSDFGPRVAVLMVPRVTSGRQRSLETMIAVEVVRALADGPVTQFSAVVEGIQIACRDNGIVLTVEPGFAL